MLRKIIRIDEALCNGCGLCATACHEGAIGMVEGRARLLREDYCDGLGDCLPACPTGAITFEEREAPAYDHAAVQAAQAAKAAGAPVPEPLPGGCPGSAAHSPHPAYGPGESGDEASPSALAQWPVQIQLAPVRAPYFEGARLLVAADCTAFARADFHSRYMQGRVTLIGCPKLDAVEYEEKLAAILRENDIRGLTVVRMEVPCCAGIAHAATKALQAAGKAIPWQVVTLGTDGRVVAEGA